LSEADLARRDGPRLCRLHEATIPELEAAMRSGQLSARELVDFYLEQIAQLDAGGPGLRSVLETNPDAPEIAAGLDQERAVAGPRGVLHGVPIVLKDNIDTADQMSTTAGSLALVGPPPLRDAGVARRLRQAGAVLLGKTNMSEWANARSGQSSSGWSARGGQTRNPYVLDRSPGGSSSGSAVAVAANLAAAAIGTETNGSLVNPASMNGVVAIKPTVGLTSRAGVIPFSHTYDTTGPFARTVTDAAILLTVLAGVDPGDPTTFASIGRRPADYTRYLDPDGLRGARIGVTRNVGFGRSRAADAVMEAAIVALRAGGAEIVDPADIPSAELLDRDPARHTVVRFEFKFDLNQYLATRTGVPVKTLADLIAFNEAHAAQELQFFGQEKFLERQAASPLTDPAYRAALETGWRLARQQGIDSVMDRWCLDGLIAPSGSPAWTIDLVNGDHYTTGSSTPAAMAGYPLVSVPAGWCHALPIGITFMGRAWSEPTLIKLAFAFEHVTRARQEPQFWPSLRLA